MNTIKKFLISALLIISVMLCFVAVGCESGAPQTPDESSQPTQSEDQYSQPSSSTNDADYTPWIL